MPPLVSDVQDFSSEPEPTAEPDQQPRRSQRPALLVLGVIGVVLLAFLAGVLVGNPLEEGTTAPGAVDIGFAQDMSVHHTQAVEMSAIALAGTSDPAVQRLAYDILTTQQNQAGRMQGWLQLWNEPMLGANGYMGWMTDSSSHHGGSSEHSGPVATMPGMATDQELTALRQATGAAQDVLFLQLMLRHHQGGMPMIEYAAQRADTDAIRTLAASMVQTQSGESQLMTRMLAERGSTPLPQN
ncbi:DUF305 domain-containing protein [Nocardia sp. NPDC127526]|uniref:DUF305 domain-containing protein n=1 Tax=Nocardia sp. NPDC127526 TaxID=3345393 RepID=UPI00363647EC